MRIAGSLLGVAGLILAFVPIPWMPALALAMALGAVLLVDPATLRDAWGLRTFLLLATTVLATGALVGWSLGVKQGLAAGLAALLRLSVLVLVLALASRTLDTDRLERVASRLGLRRLGLACGLALNTMPHLADACRDAWIALGARRGRQHPRPRDLGLLAETLLAHTARIAEQAGLAAALRGHGSLSALPSPGRAAPPLFIVTGRSGRGKTPALQSIVVRLHEVGVPVRGFLQLPLWREGRKDGFSLRDLSSGEEAPLARRAADDRGQHGTPFLFDAAGFKLARQATRSLPAGTVLVVDEVGAVELRGAGHWPALRRALAHRGLAAVLLSMRRPVVPAFLALLRASSPVVVDVELVADPVAEVMRALEPILGLPLR
jgi:nucleoside-triphosphatase THEP1